jgi:DNA-binding NtrC family response regulator
MRKPSELEKVNLLVVDDQPENLDVLIAHLEQLGFTISVALNGKEAIELAKEFLPDLILLDIIMPGIGGFETCCYLKQDEITRDIPVIFITALLDTIEKVKGFEAGGMDYITKPFQNEEVLARINAHLTIRHQQKKLEEKNAELTKLNAELIKLNKQLKQEIERREKAENALQEADAKLSVLSEQEAERWGISAFIGKSQTIITILDKIRRLQDVEKTSVLILGESGTGKELIARAIHFGGTRAKCPFIPVNCSAIPDELAESAFFGHVRGAFTGAVNDRKGYFELAQSGTLFLDEIGDMPRHLQAKLLRTLEDGTFMPVGGNHEKKVNVRIIAATNANLPTKIATGDFRNDLYYRIAGYIVHVPPLRERKEDISLLVKHLLSLFAVEMGRPKAKLTHQALATLKNYHFPGNIRELKNLIEHALISSGGALIQPQHFHFAAQPPLETTSIPSTVKNTGIQTEPTLRVSDEEKIIAYVREHGYIKNAQCRQLLNSDYHRTSYLLKKMSKEEKLVREGERRGSYYIERTSKS